MSGQYYTPTALALGENTPVPIAYQAGWAPEAVRTFWKREKSLTLAEYEPLIVTDYDYDILPPIMSNNVFGRDFPY